MRTVAWATLFSLFYLSFHVTVDHALVVVACGEKGPFYNHFHTEEGHHSHSHDHHSHPSGEPDSNPADSSHDPSAHDHEETLFRESSGNGQSVGMSIVALVPLDGPAIILSESSRPVPVLEISLPPPKGKTFLSLQALLI